jgi:hypothetical protein
MSAIDLPESLLIGHWNAAFPQWPDAPMPFLRLRAKAWELFCESSMTSAPGSTITTNG